VNEAEARQAARVATQDQRLSATSDLADQVALYHGTLEVQGINGAHLLFLARDFQREHLRRMLWPDHPPGWEGSDV
jgi:hypothetical protein